MSNRKTSLLCLMLLATTLGVGFGTVWLVLTVWLGTSIQSAMRGRSSWEDLPPRENLIVRSDGTPLIVKYANGLSTQTTYRDLDGRPQDVLESQDQIPEMAMSVRYDPYGFFVSRVGWDQRIEYFMDEREPNLNWYFLHDGKSHGAGYFVGYERKSNRLIGTIGLSGFRPHSVPVEERIPVRGPVMAGYSHWSSASPWAYQSIRGWQYKSEPWDVPPRLVFVPSGNKILLVDLGERTITTVFEAPEPIESVGVPTVTSFSGGQVKEERPVQVRTRRKIYSLDRTYKVSRIFTIPDEIDPQSRVSWFEIGDGRAIVAFDRPYARAVQPHLTHKVIYRVEGDGSIANRSVIDLKNGVVEGSEANDLRLFAIVLPVPALLLSLGTWMPMSVDPTLTLPSAIGRLLKDAWPALAAVLAISAILAVVAWRRGWAFGDARRERNTWMVFVFLLGLPAFVGFLLARRWPAREVCPSCREEVPRDRELCAECGALFPEPAPLGIEIFA